MLLRFIDINPVNSIAYAKFYSRRLWPEPFHHSVSQTVCKDV